MVLGMPTSNEQDNGTVLANDSELIFTNYSLYLMAVIGIETVIIVKMSLSLYGFCR